jgi:3-phenylpropionate/trans-cinnamate dioxygenase ferredoxin subunit
MESNVKVQDVPTGTISALKLGNESVAIANVDGTLYAFSGVCTHRGCPLSEGRLSGQEVICGCHGSRFNVQTGAVLGGPARDVLKTYEVSVDGDNVTVSE